MTASNFFSETSLLRHNWYIKNCNGNFKTLKNRDWPDYFIVFIYIESVPSKKIVNRILYCAHCMRVTLFTWLSCPGPQSWHGQWMTYCGTTNYSWAFASIGQSVIPGGVGVEGTETLNCFSLGRNYAHVATSKPNSHSSFGTLKLKVKHTLYLNKGAWKHEIFRHSAFLSLVSYM